MQRLSVSPFLLLTMLAGAIGFPLAFSPSFAASIIPKKEFIPEATASAYAATSSQDGAKDISDVLERKKNAELELGNLGSLESDMLRNAAASQKLPQPAVTAQRASDAQAAKVTAQSALPSNTATLALLDGALQAAQALEQRQKHLLERTGKIREEIRRLESPSRAMLNVPQTAEVVASAAPVAAAQPAALVPAKKGSALEENSVDLLRRQREVLVDEVIRLRRRMKSGSPQGTTQALAGTGAKMQKEFEQLQTTISAERARADQLQAELEKVRSEQKPGTPASALENELRESLAYQQERADKLEQQHAWLSDQMKALRRYSTERRQINTKIMAQESEVGELKLKVMALDGVDEENDRLRQALHASKVQLESVQGAAQEFLHEKNAEPEPERVAEAGIDTTPASGTVIQGNSRPTPTAKKLDAVISNVKRGAGKQEVPMFVSGPGQIIFK